MIKKFLEADFFLENILVPAAALTAYCFSFAYLSHIADLKGVNYFFAVKLGNYALFLSIASLLLWLFLKFRRKSMSGTNNFARAIRPQEAALLLPLPLTPVAQYVLNNQDILSPKESALIFLIFLLFSALYVILIPSLLAGYVPVFGAQMAGLAFAFTVANMAAMSNQFHWFEKGTLRYQAGVLLAVFASGWLLYRFKKKAIFHLFIAANFASTLILQAPPNIHPPKEQETLEENKLLALVQNKQPVFTPGVYLLIYDSYSPPETMRAYGIDNAPQENFLKEQGFKIYPHVYSIAAHTLASMTAVLNVSANDYHEQRDAVAGNGAIQNILKENGYQTYGLFYSDYMFRGVGEMYDVAIPESGIPLPILVSKAIFMGEFRFNIGDIEFKGEDREVAREEMQNILKGISRKPVFVYMHNNLPGHSQNSGACLPNEAGLYEERLSAANLEMRRDIHTILANDPGAIVVIAGDHGPFLTKNCRELTDAYKDSEITRLDIQDRYGTFLAIRWPAKDFEEYDDITVLQDVFPAVVSYMYKDAAILQSKIKPVIPIPNFISGVSVENGVIRGGINDGEPLFTRDK